MMMRRLPSTRYTTRRMCDVSSRTCAIRSGARERSMLWTFYRCDNHLLRDAHVVSPEHDEFSPRMLREDNGHTAMMLHAQHTTVP